MEGKAKREVLPLVPKKYLLGWRYRLKPHRAHMVCVDDHGIVDFPISALDWPPQRWLGFVMGYVAKNDDEITWDADAMAQRPFRPAKEQP